MELVLESERCAIEKYNRLAIKYHMKDLVTHEILKTYLLTDEVSDEEELKLVTSHVLLKVCLPVPLQCS